MIVSSGLKTAVTVASKMEQRASVGAIRTKDGSYRNVAMFIVAVQDIAAV